MDLVEIGWTGKASLGINTWVETRSVCGGSWVDSEGKIGLSRGNSTAVKAERAEGQGECWRFMGQGISVQTQCQYTGNNWPHLLAGMKLRSESRRPKRIFSEMNDLWENKVQEVSSGGGGPLNSVWHHGTLSSAHRVWTYVKGQCLSIKAFEKGNNSSQNED